MLGCNASQPALFQMVELERLVPADHRLRKIDAVLDLYFVREAVAACYSANRGRPSRSLRRPDRACTRTIPALLEPTPRVLGPASGAAA